MSVSAVGGAAAGYTSHVLVDQVTGLQAGLVFLPGHQASGWRELAATSSLRPIDATLPPHLAALLAHPPGQHVGTNPKVCELPDTQNPEDLIKSLAGEMLASLKPPEEPARARWWNPGRQSIYDAYFKDAPDVHEAGKGGKTQRRRILCTLCNRKISLSNKSTHMKAFHLPAEDCRVCGAEVAAAAWPRHRRVCKSSKANTSSSAMQKVASNTEESDPDTTPEAEEVQVENMVKVEVVEEQLPEVFTSKDSLHIKQVKRVVIRLSGAKWSKLQKIKSNTYSTP